MNESIPFPVVVDAEDVPFLSAPVVVADVRWYLDGRSGATAYERGHIPGAVFVDLEGALSTHDLPDTAGRHPFPAPARFAAAMSELGIGDDTTVVAYDDTGGMTAGRLVVMLRMLGCRAAILNGGIDAWQGPLDVGPQPKVKPSAFTTRSWPTERFAMADELNGLGRVPGLIALDGRPAERFSGAVVSVDPRPGHVPGAVSAPWATTLQANSSRLRSSHELWHHYHSLGVDADSDVVAYCGSGVSACLNVLAMEHAGFRPPRLFVASFSGWAADPDRPTSVEH